MIFERSTVEYGSGRSGKVLGFIIFLLHEALDSEKEMSQHQCKTYAGCLRTSTSKCVHCG